MIRVEQVIVGGSGDGIGLQVGDRLVAIDGKPIRDILDFYLYSATEQMSLEVLKSDGEEWEVEIEKAQNDDLSIVVEHPDPTSCGNNCMFCFVHQLPKGMRNTLYVKDEDYRFSYLYGSYVTLSNISETDLERIIDQQLTPIYVSVHATDEQVRERLLGRASPPILPILERLVAAGIEIHTQVVVCPEINDGEVLHQTIDDLSKLYPGITSLAVVPVGLTKHRERLPDLRLLRSDEAQSVLTLIDTLQQRFLSQHGTRFVFAADELFLNAAVEFPDTDEYEGFPQIENGIGLIPTFRIEADEVIADAVELSRLPVSIVTGMSAYNEIKTFAQRLTVKTSMSIEVYPVVNRFFGETVTVTGLLTGADIIEQLQGKELGSALLIPDIMLKDGEELFLDDITLDELQMRLSLPVYKIPSDPWGLIDFLELEFNRAGDSSV